MSTMKRMILGVALAAGGGLSSGIATAADVPAEPAPLGAPDWIVEVTPYMWAAGMEGEISPFRRGPTIHVEQSFSDTMKDFNMGGFLNVWARRDRFVFSGDLMYVNTTAAKSVGILPDLVPGGVELSAEVDSIQLNATLQGGYRVVDTPRFFLDALAGGRYWYVSNDVTVRLENVASVSHEESFNWIDPLVGARAFYNVTDRLSVMAQADIGGFGVGSDLTWSVLGTVNYILTDHFSVSAGYKHLEVDYEKNGHVFDTTLTGPVLGVTYRFN